MNSINIIGKMLKAVDEKGEIKLKLNEIRRNKNSFNINLNRLTDLIDKDKLDKEDLKKENEKYKIIAKLSFDLYIDYEYYREFSIKNKSTFGDYSEELTNLGYELRDNDEWVNVKRPNTYTIIDNIFMSQLCRSILSQCECCDAIIGEDQSMCDNCVDSSNKKYIAIDKRGICDSCGRNKIIVLDGMCNDCHVKENYDWKCLYRFCGQGNLRKPYTCISCGLGISWKPIFGAPIWRSKNDKHDEVWVCENCNIVNDIDKVCSKCGFTLSYFSETKKMQNNYKLTRKRHHSEDDDDEEESYDDFRTSWDCERCRCTNETCNVCKDCGLRRSFKGRLSTPNRESEMSVEFERTNREMEEDMTGNSEIEEQKETVVEGVSRDILSDSMLNWKCPFVYCKRTNSGEDSYCQDCKICRHANLEHGAPNLRFKNNQLERVWVCNDCGTINKWEEMVCQDTSNASNGLQWVHTKKCTSEREKFFKWCMGCSSKFEKTESKCRRCNIES